MVDSATEISSDLIKSALNDLVEEKLKTKEFEIKVDAGSKEGDNFIGVVYRVTYWRKAKPNEQSRLILKVSPQSQARRERFFSRPSFLREMFLYGEVSRVRTFNLLIRYNEKGFLGSSSIPCLRRIKRHHFEREWLP